MTTITHNVITFCNAPMQIIASHTCFGGPPSVVDTWMLTVNKPVYKLLNVSDIYIYIYIYMTPFSLTFTA